jgi:hypothetical protein
MGFMKHAVGLFFLALACEVGVAAQAVAGFGAIRGTIRDAAGEGIPDTTVRVSNDSFAVSRELMTTDDGVFNVPALIPAPGYTLHVSRKGFKDRDIKDIEISLGRTLNFTITLQSEQSTGEPNSENFLARVNDTKYDITEAIPPREMDTLPTDNRRIDSLVESTPAASVNNTTGIFSIRGEQFTTGLFTDGAYTTGTHYLQRPGFAPEFPQESLGQMQVLAGGSSADLGGSAGGIVNAVVPNGTNKLHGLAYDYFNDRSLDAGFRYAPGFHPTGWQHQAGANGGGAILRDRLFWFGSLEWVENKAQALNRITNPLIVNSAGTAVLPSNCGAPATPAQCTAAINFVNPQLNVVVPKSLHSINGLARFDYHLDSADVFSVDIEALHRHAPNGAETEAVTNNGGLLGYNADFGEETRFAKVDWNRTLLDGVMFNDMRASFFRDRTSNYTESSLLPSTGAMGLTIAGTPLGGNPSYPMALSEKRWEFADNISLTMNTHLVKGGFGYTFREDWLNQVFNRFGTYNFSSLTTFAEDFSSNTNQRKDYTSFTQGFGVPVIDLKAPEMYVFLQDTWRPIRRLSVNMGFRWEKTFMPSPPYQNPSYYQTGSIPSPNKDFGPRLGVNYLLGSRTVIRAGFGFFYQPFPGQLLDSLYTGNAINQLNVSLNSNQTGSPFFPKVILGPTSVPTGATNVAYSTGGKFRNPYTQVGTVSIERRLRTGTVLTVGGIASRGRDLWAIADQNLNVPTITKTYTIDNANGAPVGTWSTPIWNVKTNNAFAHAYIVNNSGGSFYHALTAQLAQELRHGLTFRGSFTWSHAIDDVSGTPVPWLGFLPSNTFLGDYRTDQGNSIYNQKYRGVVSWTWQENLTKGKSALERYFVNGWEISGIGTFASSMYETPLVITNGQQFSGITMVYTNSLNGSGGWARVPFVSVGTLPTGPQYSVSARLARPIPITERIRATLMLEGYNALNTQFNTSVNTLAYTATSGILKPVAGVGAGNSANGFPYGTNARRVQVALRIEF